MCLADIAYYKLYPTVCKHTWYEYNANKHDRNIDINSHILSPKCLTSWLAAYYFGMHFAGRISSGIRQCCDRLAGWQNDGWLVWYFKTWAGLWLKKIQISYSSTSYVYVTSHVHTKVELYLTIIKHITHGRPLT